MASFETIKQNVTIEQVAQMLNLTLKKELTSLRCECPVHGGHARSLALSPSKNLFFCQGTNSGGSCIDLAAHILEISEREAAEAIAKHFKLGSSTAPPTPAKKEEAAPRSNGMQPLELDPFHESVEALGLSPATADMVGIGHSVKGFFRGGAVGVPVRLPSGELLGYFAIPEGSPVKFHKSIEQNASNIVELRKKA